MKFNEPEYFQYPNEIATLSFPADKLSTEAEILLKHAVLSRSGEIVKVGSTGGLSIEANGKTFNQGNSARESAKWEAAVNELDNNELFVGVGYRGKIYTVTQKGYDYADSLK